MEDGWREWSAITRCLAFLSLIYPFARPAWPLASFFAVYYSFNIPICVEVSTDAADIDAGEDLVIELDYDGNADILIDESNRKADFIVDESDLEINGIYEPGVFCVDVTINGFEHYNFLDDPKEADETVTVSIADLKYWDDPDRSLRNPIGAVSVRFACGTCGSLSRRWSVWLVVLGGRMKSDCPAGVAHQYPICRILSRAGDDGHDCELPGAGSGWLFRLGAGGHRGWYGQFFRGEGVCLWFVVVWTGCVVYRKSLFLFSPTYT